MGVKITPKEVIATIHDHGVGFDADKTPKHGMGLETMKERAELLGGSFELTPEPERGARAEVRLPLVRRKNR